MTLSDPPTPAASPRSSITTPSNAAPDPSARASRDELIAALGEEMSRWTARGRLGAMRRWHQGALSLIHLNVLNVLEVDGPVSMSAVAEALDVSIASATGIVDRMEKRGLVERRHSTDDRRVVEVHPTEQGRAVTTEVESQMRTHMTRLITELTDEELAAFLLGLRAMHRARGRLHDAEASAAEAPAP